MQISDSLRKKLEFIKSHVPTSHGVMKLCTEENNPITPQEAEMLYNMDNDTYVKEVGIKKSLIYLFLSDEKKIEHINDVQYFNNMSHGLLNFIKTTCKKEHTFEQIFYRAVATHAVYDVISICKVLEDTPSAPFKALILKQTIDSYIRQNSMDQEADVEKMLSIDVDKKDKCEIILRMIKKLNYIYPSIIYAYNKLGDEEKSYILNNLVKDPLVIKADKFLDMLEFSPYEGRKDVILKFLEKSPDNIALLKTLDDEDIIEIFKNENMTCDDLTTFLNKSTFSEEFLRKMYDAMMSDENLEKRYFNEEFIGYLDDVIDSSEMEEIFVNKVLPSKNLTPLQKCTILYNAYDDDDRYWAINELLKYPYGHEMDMYFDELTFGQTSETNICDYPNIAKYLCQRYNIKNTNNLRSFFDRFGYDGLGYLQNENILYLIDLSEEDFEKTMGLFSNDSSNLSMNEVNQIANALIQRKFRLENSQDYNIFGTFESLLQEKSKENVEQVVSLLQKMNTVINASNMCEGMEIKDFVNALFNHDEKAINMLHNMTNAYIAKQRELYSALHLNEAIHNLDIDAKYDKTYIKKAYFKYNDFGTIYSQLLSADSYVELDDAQEELINSGNRLYTVISFKKNPSSVTMTPELKNDIKILDSILDKLYEENALQIPEIPEDAKFSYSPLPVDNEYTLSVLSNINFSSLKNNILNDEDKYNKLLKYVKKYKITGWGTTFDSLSQQADIDTNDLSVAYLISYFDKIETMAGENASLTDRLDYANAYASASNKYPILINTENYNLILANPGPNSSSAPKSTRISHISDFVTRMYERDSITVPSGTTTVEIDNGKKLNVTVGDIYDPMNLTLGERTGACLRICGVFRDLFEYCLVDKNGFHIVITDPQTGEFVSRVSGIRNGNTVFLNELRYSVSDKYSDNDLIKALNTIAKQLVESTKDDPNPIENVIVSNDYAMQYETSEDLHITNTTLAFNSLNFNITTTGHILYTASEDHKTLLPYKFGDENVSEYKPFNTKGEYADGARAKEALYKVYIIDKLLKGEKFQDISLPDIDFEIRKCIYGNGWIVYLDEEGNMHEHIIDKFKNDKELLKLVEDSKNKLSGGNKHEQNNGKNNRV